jgi:hypothetical protein
MDQYLARIVRAVIVSVLGFGGGTGLMVFIIALVLKGNQHALQYGLNAGLIIGGIFAIFLIGVLLPLDLTSRLFVKNSDYKEIWELEQKRECTVKGSLKEAKNFCRQALLAVSNVKLVYDDAEYQAIRALTSSSWKSSGEEIDAIFTSLAEDTWKIVCVSRPLSKNIVFDYSKNFENVELWHRHMEKLSKEKTVRT